MATIHCKLIHLFNRCMREVNLKFSGEVHPISLVLPVLSFLYGLEHSVCNVPTYITHPVRIHSVLFWDVHSVDFWKIMYWLMRFVNFCDCTGVCVSQVIMEDMVKSAVTCSHQKEKARIVCIIIGMQYKCVHASSWNISKLTVRS